MQIRNKEELIAARRRKWDEDIDRVASIYIIPNGRLRDNGWMCMDFVAEPVDDVDDKTLVKIGGCCDDLKLNGSHFSIDCIPDGIIRIWRYDKQEFYVSHDASTMWISEKQFCDI